MTDENDGWDELELNEDFIRSAAVREPSATTRKMLAPKDPPPPTKSPKVPQTKSAKVKKPQRQRREASRTRLLVVVGLVALAVLVGVVAKLSAGRHDHHVTTLNDRVYAPGHCYRWTVGVQSQPAIEVACTQPHLFEAVTSLTLTGKGFSRSSSFPSAAAWQLTRERVCRPATTSFLHHPLDPEGRFTLTDLQPTDQGWAQGDRHFVCGLGDPPQLRLGVRSVGFGLFTGRVETSTEAQSWPVGTCLRLHGREPLIVPCSDGHQLVVAGTATVHGSKAPTQLALGTDVHSQCEAAASRLAHKTFVPTATEVLVNTILPPTSWAAGTRTVTCEIGYVNSKDHYVLHKGP